MRHKGLLKVFFLSVLFCLGVTSSQLLGWGKNGHRIVGEIAQRHLTATAASEIARLLRGRGLAQVGNWADEIRSDPAWECAAPFHYVTVPAGKIYPEQTLAAEGDAISAVAHYAGVLANPDAATEQRVWALQFLVHIVGDLHQPLHVGRGCDRGGNQIRVSWFGRETNLHGVWDREIIASEELSYTEFVSFIDRDGGEKDQAETNAGPLKWIAEAQDLQAGLYQCFINDGCPCFCGDCPEGLSTFGGCESQAGCGLMIGGPVAFRYRYKNRHEPVVERQLLRGGLRLAAMLNWILSEDRRPPGEFQELTHRLQATGDWEVPFRSCPQSSSN
ncbi:MAG: S1/P1 nuclease [Acidobacteriota bacterium]